MFQIEPLTLYYVVADETLAKLNLSPTHRVCVSPVGDSNTAEKENVGRSKDKKSKRKPTVSAVKDFVKSEGPDDELLSDIKAEPQPADQASLSREGVKAQITGSDRKDTVPDPDPECSRQPARAANPDRKRPAELPADPDSARKKHCPTSVSSVASQPVDSRVPAGDNSTAVRHGTTTPAQPSQVPHCTAGNCKAGPVSKAAGVVPHRILPVIGRGEGTATPSQASKVHPPSGTDSILKPGSGTVNSLPNGDTKRLGTNLGTPGCPGGKGSKASPAKKGKLSSNSHSPNSGKSKKKNSQMFEARLQSMINSTTRKKKLQNQLNNAVQQGKDQRPLWKEQPPLPNDRLQIWSLSSTNSTNDIRILSPPNPIVLSDPMALGQKLAVVNDHSRKNLTPKHGDLLLSKSGTTLQANTAAAAVSKSKPKGGSNSSKNGGFSAKKSAQNQSRGSNKSTNGAALNPNQPLPQHDRSKHTQKQQREKVSSKPGSLCRSGKSMVDQPRCSDSGGKQACQDVPEGESCNKDTSTKAADPDKPKTNCVTTAAESVTLSDQTKVDVAPAPSSPDTSIHSGDLTEVKLSNGSKEHSMGSDTERTQSSDNQDKELSPAPKTVKKVVGICKSLNLNQSGKPVSEAQWDSKRRRGRQPKTS